MREYDFIVGMIHSAEPDEVLPPDQGDELAARFVVVDGHKMPLRNRDLTKAIELAIKNLLPQHILAERVGISENYLNKISAAQGFRWPHLPRGGPKKGSRL